MTSPLTDETLVLQIRQGAAQAWQECIARYEGRLLAYVRGRTGDFQASEDLVQETFLGFLVSLPNYNPETPLETFLFSIAAYKLTDWLRSRGRRPFLAPLGGDESADVPGRARVASSLARSVEQRSRDERALAAGLRQLIGQWQQRGDFERLKCIELLFRLGWSNKQTASELGLSEQAVANHKHYVLRQLREFVRATATHADEIAWSELGLTDAD